MTPAINLLKREKIAHTVRSYVHDAHAESYGGEAVDKLGLDPAQVFKTLLASTEAHELLVAIVPVAGQLDLKALAEAAGCKKCEMAAADAAQRATGYLVGGISPLGQKKRLRTFRMPALRHCPRCMSAPVAAAWKWNWRRLTCCASPPATTLPSASLADALALVCSADTPSRRCTGRCAAAGPAVARRNAHHRCRT